MFHLLTTCHLHRITWILALAFNIKTVINIYDVLICTGSDGLILAFDHIEHVILIFVFYSIRSLIIGTFQNISLKCKISILHCSRFNFLTILVHKVLHKPKLSFSKVIVNVKSTIT